MWALGVYFAVINLVGFAQMAWDKYRAKTGGWRVPEKTLIGTALLGGSLGVLTAMRLLRHKTRHAKFSVGVPAIIALQVAAVAAFQFLRDRGV